MLVGKWGKEVVEKQRAGKSTRGEIALQWSGGMKDLKKNRRGQDIKNMEKQGMEDGAVRSKDKTLGSFSLSV